MALGREDTNRIVRFCMAGTGWGTAVREDDACVIKITRSGPAGRPSERFEGATFEEALDQAARAGTLKASCLEKQIAFLARSLPDRGRPDAEPTPELEPVMTEASRRLYPAITTAISALVHETQRERGTSSLYATSHGRLFGRELARQWETTDQRRAELAAFVERHAAGLPRSALARLTHADELLAGVVALRPRVQALEIAPPEVIERYTRVNSALLAVIDDLTSDAIAADRARPAALAWMALLHAKEKTGIERAELVSVFASDHYLSGQHAAVSAAIASRHSYLHLFSAAAPRAADELLRALLTSPVEQAVSEMERVALLKHEGGFGIDPTAWFTSISRKIDLFGDVETAVRVSLS